MTEEERALLVLETIRTASDLIREAGQMAAEGIDNVTPLDAAAAVHALGMVAVKRAVAMEYNQRGGKV